MSALAKVLEPPPSIPPEAIAFREGMSRIAAAVHIITVADRGEIGGVTATAVSSVTDSPPTLLVCLHRAGKVHSMLREGTQMVVNTLGGDHRKVADVFAGVGKVPMEERFSHGNWQVTPGKAPVLVDSAVSFVGVVESVIESGSHSVILCRITSVVPRDKGMTLVYLGRKYSTMSFI